MCTLALYSRCARSRPMVVAANRDEIHARPTAEPQVVAHDPWVVAGQDLVAGGTWLGLNQHGMVAGLLNRRSETGPDPARRSRGLLCFEALQAGDPEAALADICDRVRGRDYNPFNLLLASPERAYVVGNDGERITVTLLSPGVHLLTNLAVDDPTCPRIAGSFQHFSRVAVDGPERDLVAALKRILSSHDLVLDPRKPDQLNTVCVHGPSFGTRSSTIIALDADGATWHYWHAAGPPCRTDFFEISLPLERN
jgi:uncharacterized protein with NRDE domain